MLRDTDVLTQTRTNLLCAPHHHLPEFTLLFRGLFHAVRRHGSVHLQNFSFPAIGVGGLGKRDTPQTPYEAQKVALNQAFYVSDSNTRNEIGIDRIMAEPMCFNGFKTCLGQIFLRCFNAPHRTQSRPALTD